MPSLNLYFDEFGLEALATHAGRGTSSVADMAARHYLADRRSRRPTWPVPRFHRTITARQPARMEVRLDDETWRALPAEAELQRVTPEELVEHAVLYFLADLHRGRFAGDPLDDGR